MTAELEPLRLSPHILAGTRADLQVACYRDGQLKNPTGSLTCSVVDADGNSIATPSVSATDGVLTATLTAAQTAQVNQLTVTWAGLVFDAEPAVSLVEKYEVRSSLLFTLAEARQAENRALMSEANYPNDAMLRARDVIVEDFEDILGFDLGTRYQREVLDGSGRARLFLEHREPSALRAVSIRSGTTWSSLSAGELAAIQLSGSAIVNEWRAWPLGVANIRVSYEAGRSPLPRSLTRAALILLKDRMLPSNLSRKAVQQVDELGTFKLATPGERGSHFGIPEVDDLLNRLRMTIPGFA